MEDTFIFFQEQTTLEILMKSGPSMINKHLSNLLSRYCFFLFVLFLLSKFSLNADSS